MARLKYFKHATRTSTLAPLLLISAKITITDDRRGQQPRSETCESTTYEKQRVRNVVRYDTKGLPDTMQSNRDRNFAAPPI